MHGKTIDRSKLVATLLLLFGRACPGAFFAGVWVSVWLSRIIVFISRILRGSIMRLYMRAVALFVA